MATFVASVRPSGPIMRMYIHEMVRMEALAVRRGADGSEVRANP
jgi:hypothetical protein